MFQTKLAVFECSNTRACPLLFVRVLRCPFRPRQSAAVFLVDLSYLEGVCQLCRVAGVDHFSLVSSQGASSSSPLLYPRVKGRCEQVRTKHMYVRDAATSRGSTTPFPPRTRRVVSSCTKAVFSSPVLLLVTGYFFSVCVLRTLLVARRDA